MMLAAKQGNPIRRLVLNDVGPHVPWNALVRLKPAHAGEDIAFPLDGRICANADGCPRSAVAKR